MSVPSEAGGEIVVDYTLKIFFVYFQSVDGHPLINVGQAFLNLSDTVG